MGSKPFGYLFDEGQRRNIVERGQSNEEKQSKTKRLHPLYGG